MAIILNQKMENERKEINQINWHHFHYIEHTLSFIQLNADLESHCTMHTINSTHMITH